MANNLTSSQLRSFFDIPTEAEQIAIDKRNALRCPEIENALRRICLSGKPKAPEKAQRIRAKQNRLKNDSKGARILLRWDRVEKYIDDDSPLPVGQRKKSHRLSP